MKIQINLTQSRILYLLFSLIGIVLISSCDSLVESNTQIKETKHMLYGKNIEEITINSCQYYYMESKSLTHKGNCSNPIHKGK